MKCIYSFLLASACLIANTGMAEGVMKIRGKIFKSLCDSITVSYNGSRLVYLPQEYTAQIKKDGTFSLTVPVINNGYTEGQIKYGNRQTDFIIASGYNITLTAQGDKFDSSVQYDGTGKEVENFVARHATERERMNGYSARVKVLMPEDSVKFPLSMQREQQRELDYLAKYKNNLPTSFINYWTVYYRYFTYFYLLQYPTIHEMVKQKTAKIKGVTKENYVVMNKVPLSFNDSFINITPYLLYANIILQSKFNAAGFTYGDGDSVKQEIIEDSLAQLTYHIMPPRTGEYVRALLLYGSERAQPIAKTKKELAEFEAHWANSEYLPLLNQQLEIVERLAPGMPAPDFKIVTPAGKTMKLSDLRGHVVYLTFWEAQCRPCVGEMIHEKKMKDLMKNKPVDFVYVTLDEDTAWHVIINHYKLEGIFTAVKGSWYSPEAQAYGVQGLPSYFLIDEEGKFAPQRAPAPQQETELILAIGKLLK